MMIKADVGRYFLSLMCAVCQSEGLQANCRAQLKWENESRNGGEVLESRRWNEAQDAGQ
jgi:hypothetical protein